MDKLTIEKTARRLQKRIWEQRESLWPTHLPNLIDMLDPRVGAHILDIDFQYEEYLTPLGCPTNRSNIAGLLDRQRGLIAISKRFPAYVQRFTGGHELGHWLLHNGMTMHRDLPLQGLTTEANRRPPQEREADYFSACYLIPRNLLYRQFEKTFSTTKPLIIDDNAAFWLSADDPYSLLQTEPDSLACELAVANATSYAGQHVRSLAEQFKVSGLSMAIRLKELELVKY